MGLLTHGWLLSACCRLLARRRLLPGSRLLGGWLLAAFLLVLGLSALGRLLAGLQRFGLRHGFTRRRQLFGRLVGLRLLGRSGLPLLVLLVPLLELIAALLIVVGRCSLVGGRSLASGLFGGGSLRLLLALLAQLVALLLIISRRSQLIGRLFSRRHLRVALLARLLLVGRRLAALVGGRGLDLLLLVTLLARLQLLFIGRRLRALIRRCSFRLLLLVALLSRLELLLGRGGFTGLAIIHLLLFLPLLARLLLGLGRGGLFGCRRRFALLLLALPLLWLFGSTLRAFLGRLAFGASGLSQHERRTVQAAGSDTPLQRVRAQRRGCHKQADCCARQNPWLAFHIIFS
ncbi:MAG: hypothetical protein E5X72_06615 [Mesorhizobium sp.]|nr:MAG: hypothetical protein E5X72_06615 [Mesorhizobium sp.]